MNDPPGFGLSPDDLDAAILQLGRPVRGHARVAVRCPCGLPAVLETYPILDEAPFPTLYWLTCRRAVREIGRLESEGMMQELNARLSSDPSFAAQLAEAQDDYVGRRDALEPIDAGGIGGGRRDRIKCLHAHYAHHAVCGCNPVGAAVEERTGALFHSPPCVGRSRDVAHEDPSAQR